MKKIFILIFSSCWVIPLLTALYLSIAFLKNEVYPIVYGSKGQLNSFPYLESVEILLHITLIWFVLVIFSWSIYYFKQSRL